MKRPGLRLALAALLPIGAAQAALAPDYYEEARRSAPNHLQIKVLEVGAPNGGMGKCAVDGEVVRLFRGTFAPGTKLTFDVSCYDYGQIPDGGTLWTDYDALKDAKFLEAFMSADAQPKIALDQVEIIVAPRDYPYCDSNSLYCESTVDGSAREESCGWVGTALDWLGLGGEACSAS